MTSAPLPDAGSNWVDRRAPEGLKPWLKLGRFDRPIGIWLLLLPGWQGIALALAGSRTAPDAYGWWLVAAFAVGACLMRAAGCAFNDIVDRDIDRQVARTAARIRQAPTAKAATSHQPQASGAERVWAKARAIPCQPGSSSSQMPMGRSKRPSFSHGLRPSGAKRSTQLARAASGSGEVIMQTV